MNRVRGVFSGSSVSSRKSGERPTSTRQMWNATSSSQIGTLIEIGRPSLPVTFTQARRSGSVSYQYSCCHPRASTRWWK